MELICPVCRKWTEVAEREVYGGGRCRCRECWSLLYVESRHPLRVRANGSSERTDERAAGTSLQGGTKDG